MTIHLDQYAHLAIGVALAFAGLVIRAWSWTNE